MKRKKTSETGVIDCVGLSVLVYAVMATTIKVVQ